MILITPRHEFSYAGAQINVYHANVGEGLPKHEHVYTHATVCHAGSIIVRKKGIKLVMTKDTQPVSLKENEWHEIEAIENGTVFANIFEIGKNI